MPQVGYQTPVEDAASLSARNYQGADYAPVSVLRGRTATHLPSAIPPDFVAPEAVEQWVSQYPGQCVLYHGRDVIVVAPTWRKAWRRAAPIMRARGLSKDDVSQIFC